MSLNDAFKLALSFQGRPAEFHDLSTDVTTDIMLSPSNYFRNLAGPEDSIIVGREFVMGKDQLTVIPVRGDKIIDSNFGVLTINEVREMVIEGVISGYRLRTE